jgi:LuxR family maltose regulon positive regulatory protein
VLGTHDADDVLAHLEWAGLFVSSLGGGWYRCHDLFRQVLRREIAGSDESVVLAKAADWFLSDGRMEEALEHRLAAGDTNGTLDLLLTAERWFLNRGASSALLRLGERLAKSIADPGLFLCLAVAAGESGQEERCVHWLEAAEPLITASARPLPGWKTLRGRADTVWSTFPAAGDAEAALRYSRRAVDLEDDPSLWGYFLARQSLGGALLGAGLSEGVDVLWDCWQSPARRDLPSLLLLQAAGQLAAILVEAGDPERARRTVQEVKPVAEAAEETWGLGAAAALAGLRLAEGRLIASTDPVAAIPALEKAVEMAESWGYATLFLAALTSLADAQWAAGDRSAARLALARASDVAESGEARPAVVQTLDSLQARIGRSTVQSARAEGSLYEELTDRELAILRALRGPLTAREIGGQLYLSVNTVKGYSKSLYRKLGVVSRTDAVRRGRELGLI